MSTLRLGALQRDAFAIFIEERDACDPGEPQFPGRRIGALLTLDAGREREAAAHLIDAANSADDSGWRGNRDCLTALARRCRGLVL